MHLSTITEWLNWIKKINITEIDLKLERVKTVGAYLNVLKPNCTVITVAGTNGKGSTIAGLEAIYRAASYHVGAFTSPMLFKHNEQVRINGKEATDEEFCQAFAKIEQARGNILLTAFEFFTLAALLIFKNYSLDILLLEVGLGGRLDAVNIIDPDISVITSIGIDHVEWLGSTREAIALEKAGIFREGKPIVCGDPNPPKTLLDRASELHSPIFIQSRDFNYQTHIKNWSWSTKCMNSMGKDETHLENLFLPSLAIQNMSTVLMTVNLLQEIRPIPQSAFYKGLTLVNLPGRIQIVGDKNGMEIYDVSHNPDAVSWLAKQLKKMPCQGKTMAVFSMLADKDIYSSIQTISDAIDAWYIAPLSDTRATSVDALLNAFRQTKITTFEIFSTITEAYTVAKHQAQFSDRIIIFGSFHTVSEVLKNRT